MKRKKWMAFFMAAIMLTLSGCSDNSKNSEKQTEKKSTSTKSKSTGLEEETTAAAIYGQALEVSTYDETRANYTMSVNPDNEIHDISDLLYGIFIEDINFAADGGLYAEMVQNRSFEFTALALNDQEQGWSDVGSIDSKVTVGDSTGGLNQNNTNYMVLTNESDEAAGIANRGFLDGMAVTEGANYSFSIYAKGMDGYEGPVYVSIMAGNEEVASGKIDAIHSEWEKYELTLTSSKTATSAVKLQVTIDQGSAALDMVSLFPEDTYKGRENGLRKDLALKLEELHPSFLRFPGGCVIEGASLATAYDWKDSIGVDDEGNPLKFNDTYGDVAARSMGQDIWTDEGTSSDNYPSYMTYGLGFYEYFLLAEDIGAVGVPVVNCGLCCMGQSNGSGPAVGTEEFERYVQDALDLVEFCKGGADTTWGKVRIAMGHEEPFELRYIGIGNEQWGQNFYSHYEAFVEAFEKAKEENPDLYGDVSLIYSAGVDDGDSGFENYIASYDEAADWLEENSDKSITDFAGATDHHYYNVPSWFRTHVDYYDEENYSRDTENMRDSTYGGGIPVFLGEYASLSNTLESALSEAAYMTGLERNSDIVKMACYAPAFGNLTATHWAPDMIWFNNHTSTASINYYVQKIFSDNVGSKLLESELTGAEIETKALGGMVGLGTWSTSAEFSKIQIKDNDSDEVLGKDYTDDYIKVSDGKWEAKKGTFIQSSTSTNTNLYGTTGSAIYFGDTSWTNYTYTLTAKKTGGEEGFLIPFAVKSKNENYFWNIGGWGNTVSCLQQVKDGSKSDQIAGTCKDIQIVNGKEYELKVVVNDSNIKCYINGALYVDYTVDSGTDAECYQVVSKGENGEIIVKLVNVTGYEKTLALDLGQGSYQETAKVQTVSGNSLKDDNILGAEEAVSLEESQISGVTNQFNFTLPKYSVTVLTLIPS